MSPLLHSLTDGVITLRSPIEGDATTIVANRDELFHRFMGEGSPDPVPTAVILDSRRRVVGWIDAATDHDWLEPGQVNIGYTIFPDHRSLRHATRAVRLMLTHLAGIDEITTAMLLIAPTNAASLAVANRTGFEAAGEIAGEYLFRRNARGLLGGPDRRQGIEP